MVAVKAAKVRLWKRGGIPSRPNVASSWRWLMCWRSRANASISARPKASSAARAAALSGLDLGTWRTSNADLALHPKPV